MEGRADVLSDVVGAQIAEWRRKRGMNREALAERCNELGLPKMSPSVITNIESRRAVKGAPRRAVTVDELMVFARALNVPPMLLLVPYPEQGGVELFPEEMIETPSAIDWISGEAYAGDSGERAEGSIYDWMQSVKPLLFLRTHRQALNTYSARLDMLRREQENYSKAVKRLAVAEAEESDQQKLDMAALAVDLEKSKVAMLRDRVLEQEGVIADLRATMAAEGCPPPPLPPEYEHIAGIEGSEVNLAYSIVRGDATKVGNISVEQPGDEEER